MENTSQCQQDLSSVMIQKSIFPDKKKNRNNAFRFREIDGYLE